MSKHILFPSILNLKHLDKAFAGREIPSTLTFRGTVKLHGTHADLVYLGDNSFYVQSRNRVLTIDKDNDGCAAFFDDKKNYVNSLFDYCEKNIGTKNVMIAGEYCGRGIQSKVAICRLPKMFVIFGIKNLDTERWVDFSQYPDLSANNASIYNISLAPSYEITIDMNNPEPAIEEINALTENVDKECPFAGIFGVKGPGEGLVWTCVEKPTCTQLWFKTKGVSHCTPIPIPVQSGSNIDDILARYLSEQRMQQGIDYLCEMNHDLSIKSITVFSKWICDDIIKEESDDIIDAGIKVTDARKTITFKACNWYRSYIKTK